MFLVEADSISHFQRASILFLFLLFLGVVQRVPHLFGIALIHVARRPADTPMKRCIVSIDQFREYRQILERVVRGHVTIQSLFERAIESFHHVGFGISRRGKMMRAVLFQYLGHVFVVKFFSVIRL